jgi:uncharacterized protein (TIGR02453 family)
MADSDRLPKEALEYLSDLGAHNDKRWYDAQRSRLERDLVEPCRGLVRRLTGELGAVFPEITGSDAKVGGSLTRLHRDVRFSTDKRPFHTHVGMHFWHRSGKKMEVPGFFLRVSPEEVLLGTGLHGPEPETLETIRTALDRDRKGWEKASRDPAFVRLWGGLEGESLKRVPAPWPADHPFAEDLRRKDFTAFARWKGAEATKPGFAARAVEHWRASGPLMGFLCRATGLKF